MASFRIDANRKLPKTANFPQKNGSFQKVHRKEDLYLALAGFQEKMLHAFNRRRKPRDHERFYPRRF